MKKLILLIGLALFTVSGIQAQRGEKVEALKVAFITERLNLDGKTAERFWPIYNQYEDEMRSFKQQMRKGKDDLSAEEMLDKEQKVLDIRKKYAPQFLKVISNEQLSNLYVAERDFRAKVLMHMKKNN